MGKGKKGGKRMNKAQLTVKLHDFFASQPGVTLSFKEIFRALHLDTHPLKMLAIDILRRIQKASKMTFSTRQASYFGRILQRLGVKSRRKTYGTYYHVVPLEVK